MLEFQHLVQVNDLADSSIRVLTRNQLWQGLVMRARTPEKFNPSLSCSTEEVGSNVFIRTIQVGKISFCEQVVLKPEEQIQTRSVAHKKQILTESTASIEEPEDGYLFVRFTYKRELEELGDGVNVGEHLKATYLQVDRDAIAMIRVLAEARLFDETIN